MMPFIEIYRYDVPFVRPISLKGEIFSRRQGLILKVGRGERNYGYGDIAPLPNFSIESLDQAQEAAIRWAKLFREPEAVRGEEQSLSFLLHTPSVLFGTECATLWLTKKAMQDPIKRGRRTVPVCGLIDASGDEALALAQDLRDRKFPAMKIKVGRGSVEEDIALICAISEIARGRMLVRVDANRAWDFDTAVRFARGTENCPIDFIEEPLAEPHRLPDLAAHTRLPIALDESVIDGLYDDEMFMDMQWAKAIVLKPTLLGGVRATQELAYEAIEHGVQPVVSSCYESGIGIIALANLALSLSEDIVPMGLDTYDKLAEDVLDRRFAPRDGYFLLDEMSECAQTINTSRMERVFSA